MPDIGLDRHDQRIGLTTLEKYRPDLGPAHPPGRFDPVYPVDHLHRRLVHHYGRDPVQHLGQCHHVVVVHPLIPGGIAAHQLPQRHDAPFGPILARGRVMLLPEIAARPSTTNKRCERAIAYTRSPEFSPVPLGGQTGGSKLARADAVICRLWHPFRWSLTRPSDCMAAYTVVGPTKRKP